MHALIEFIAGIVAALAMAALSQFGVELRDQRADEPEVRRVKDDCPPQPTGTILISAAARKC
ncbi:MAG TPA: hypothetical protein VGR32_00145 [Brevundimonas sp.]|jgi:hypothetical protein|uniref:hypothetical protein n=1 Tax=Brevundimonas sp. TaxID=1871086 RepID=UPI002DE9B383|nr:hypothetical protein [Brevundimonas sp.]